MPSAPSLFSPISVGTVNLQTRVVLAPLTRVRALPGNVPSQLQAEYYAQRAVDPGTLLVSEATYIAPESAGAPIEGDGLVPGIWSPEQIKGWSHVIRGIHKNNSFFFLQLWDIGRVAWYSELQKLGNYVPTGPSSISKTPNPHLRALTREEIKTKVQLYVQAAKNALKAGADGVEIHAANGYLLDTFLRSASNQRTDEYGGSVENRARFILEVVDAIVEAVGAQRTALRLSPWSTFQDIDVDEKETPEQFLYLFEELQKRAHAGNELAYVHVVEPRFSGDSTTETGYSWESNEPFRRVWKGILIRAGGYKRETALKDSESGENTLIAFGRLFLANPDLVERLKKDRELNAYDRSTFYVPGPKGYTDYPVWKE